MNPSLEPSTYSQAWAAIMQARDANVIRLSVMALSVVVAWVLKAYAPAPIIPYLRHAYLVGGMVLYILTIAVAFWSLIYG